MNKKFRFKYALLSLLLFFIPIAVLDGHSNWTSGGSGGVNDTSSQIATPTEQAPIAYIGSTYYPTIEGALRAAKNNSGSDTIVVIPTLSSDYYTPSYVITRDCEVASGDTLIIATRDDSSNIVTSYTKESSTNLASFPDSSDANVKKYLKSNIGLNATLTINGTLTICGTVGGSSQGQPIGHIVSNYSQLCLYDDAKINCNGTINCFGYIKEYYSKTSTLNTKPTATSTNNSCVYMKSGSVLNMPMVVYDFMGGTYSTACLGISLVIYTYSNSPKAFPFNTFDFPNIQSTVNVVYGAKIHGYGQIYMQSAVYPFDADIVATSGSMFVMSSGSEIEMKFNSPSSKYTYAYKNNGTGTSYISTTTLVAKTGTLTFGTVTLSLAGESIKSSDYFLPISYKFDIHVRSGATVTLSYKVKFLAGSRLTVDSGGTVNFNSNVIFHQNYNTFDYYSATTYPASTYLTNGASSTLLNNGTININSSFGGHVEVGTSGAKVVTGSSFANSVTSNEGYFDSSATNTSCKWYALTGYANGYINSTENKSFVKSLTYTSNGTYWSGSNSSTLSSVETKSGPNTVTRSSSCITGDSLVMLADGSQKRINELKLSDTLMTFNHETGQYEPAPVLGICNHGYSYENVVKLIFDNGTELDIINEHGLLSVEEQKYIAIRPDNCYEQIGKRFVIFDNNSIVSARLVDARLSYQKVESWALASYKNQNAIINGLVTVTSPLNYTYNFFDMDENMKYINMDEDIQRYGLYTFEDWANYVDEFSFDAFNFKYMKVLVGKGIITEQEIIHWCLQMREWIEQGVVVFNN